MKKCQTWSVQGQYHKDLTMEKTGLEDEGILIPPELVKQMQIVVQADGPEYREALTSILRSTWIEERRPKRIKRSTVPVKEERAEENPANSDEVLGDELTNFAQIETEECREEGTDDVGESDEEEVDQERVEDEPVRDNGIPGNSIDGGLEESDEEAADNDGLYDNRTNPGSKENKSKLLECSICEISFTRNNNLKKHKKTAHGDLAKKYPCTICKKEFKIYGLKDHMNKIHSSKSYHCPQCDYVALYAARLKAHVQSVHEGIRYPCSHCDYQATKNSDLRNHIRYVHDGVRDFPCSQCDHKAKRKHEFQKHVARRH